MEELLKKIKSQQPVCYLSLGQDCLRLWNFMAQPMPLFNTNLLFRAAVRPHFDYFLRQLDFFSLEPGADLAMAEDENFKAALTDVATLPEREVMLKQVSQLVKQQSARVTLITTPDLAKSTPLPASRTIILKDQELFGNVEPVWRKLCLQLPAKTDTFYLALGPEKFLIGPRLKLKFQLPVLDVRDYSPKPVPTYHKIKQRLKRLMHRA